MGGKLLWVGLTIIVAIAEVIKLTASVLLSPVIIAGAIIMIVGLILYLLDK